MSIHHAAADAPAERQPDQAGKGLRSDSVGLLAVVALGLASVAPAYSIAVTLGFVVMVVGHLAPAALLIGFVPILLTAFAFRELNREMPDCGTVFVWNTRAFGPYTGWLSGGWVVQIATVIAMTALARVGAGYLLTLLGLDSLASNNVAVIATAVLILAVVTAIAYRGLQIAAEVQYVLLGLQLIALFGFGAAAFARGGAETPSLSWLNPLAFDGFGPMAEAVLLCLFIYWGWDALITVNEETKDSDKTPGRAAVISTVLLLGTYLFTAFAAISFAGTGTDGLGLGNADNAADVLATLGPPVLGTALAKVVEFAICVSAISALLTCVISSSADHVVDGQPRCTSQGVQQDSPHVPHAGLRHRLLRGVGCSPARGVGDGLRQLPRRRHPVRRPTHRLLLRRHRPGVRVALPSPPDRIGRATCSSRASCPPSAGWSCSRRSPAVRTTCWRRTTERRRSTVSAACSCSVSAPSPSGWRRC